MFNPKEVDTLIARLRDLNEADDRLIAAFAQLELELLLKSELDSMLEPEPDLDLWEMIFTPPPLEPELAW